MITKCNLPGNWQGQYNPGTMLLEEQLLAITGTLLTSEGLVNVQDYEVFQIDTRNHEVMVEQIYYVLESVSKSKPVALHVSDDSHWRTICVLPDKHNPEQINLVSMDGKTTNTMSNDPNLQRVFNALQSQASNWGMKVSDLYNMSIEGQQYDNSCGLDTALNAVAIIKTYISYDIPFSQVDFKNALDNNIYYQRKDDEYYICGKKSSLTQEEIVKSIGNDLLLRSLRANQYSHGIQQPQDTIKEALARLQDQSPQHNTNDISAQLLDTKGFVENLSTSPEYNNNASNNIGQVVNTNDISAQSLDTSDLRQSQQETSAEHDNNILPVASQSNAQVIGSNSNDISAQLLDTKGFVENLSTSSGDNNNTQPKINDTQQTQFYKDLNYFLEDDTNKKLLAKYIKDNCIEVKENDSQLQVVDFHLQENMKEVIDMAKGDQNISLGLINGFIIYLANLVGWEQSNLFDIVNKNTTAKRWAEKIKEDNKVERKDTLSIM